MRQTAHQISLAIQIAIILLGVSVLGYLKYVDGEFVNKPLVINGNALELPVTKEQYRPGEMVLAEIDFCKQRDLVARVQWHLVNTHLTIFPAKESSLPVGCEHIIMEVERIPAEAYPGDFYFEGTVAYKVNDLKTVVYTIKTQTFFVVK